MHINRKDVSILKDDFFNLILQAEKEYHEALVKIEKEGGKYIEGCKLNQHTYIEQLKQEWQLFEQSENEKFEKLFSEDEQKMEAEAVLKKEELLTMQKLKADMISSRLKEEVLSLYDY